MFWKNDIALSFSRLFSGISYGFIYITIVTQIADNAMKTVRGYLATSFAQSLLLGLIIGVGFSEQTWKGCYMRLIFCAVLIAFPIATIIMTRFCTFEPVTRLLYFNLETEARNVRKE